MTSTEGTKEPRKLDQQRPPSMDMSTEGSDNRDTHVEKSAYSKSLPSSRPQQAHGRPPHAPYSKQAYPPAAHYAGYPGATRPTQQLQSVVTSSFSAEDEREASHRGVFPPVPRHVNVSVSQTEQQRWGAPTEERYPSEGVEVDLRDMGQETRQQPPTLEGRPTIVPPSPARGASPPGRYPSLPRGPGTGRSFMGPPEPLKRSFWHHSRPDDELASSSLPAEFIPPKRAKITSSTPRGEPLPARSPNHAQDMRDLRRPPSFFNRAFSWESRDEQAYFHGTQPLRAPSPRESPRYAPDQGRSFHPNMGGSPHHPSPSPPPQYREGELSRPPPQNHHYPYPPPPPQDHFYQYHHNSPSHAAAAAAAAANHHHSRRWGPYDNWGQPYMPSPTSGARRSPTYYHHPPSMSPTHQYRDDVESSRVWSQLRERESMHDDPRRLPQFDDSPFRLNSPYGRTMPPLHNQPPSLPPMNNNHNAMYNENMERRYSVGADNSRTEGPPKEVTVNNDGQVEASKDGPLLLLALPEDRISLSETLCVVRENIEVFTATKGDVEAPAPGRKHAVVVGQIGLRCIHCRHKTRSSDRVKRAVCYPSSIKRIYRTVIDMKLDHFLQCKFVPAALKDRLAELKVKHTRSTGTTMQYFIKAAHSLGLEDGPSGVRFNDSAKHRLTDISSRPKTISENLTDPPGNTPSTTKTKPKDSKCSGNRNPGDSEHRSINRMDSTLSSGSAGTLTTPGSSDANAPDTLFTGKVNLALPEDKMALSPLRCFLRSQVCAFSATAEDIAVRAPTTFSITVGQVGVGCVHCLGQPSKLRSNRAVCFPFSISRIYQSVADIQRFHFGECKMLPADVKEKFLSLQKASSKGSKGLATRQYWITSAKKLGLVDTPRGIRFGRDPQKPEQTSMSLDILAQVAFNVTTASRALVLPEDKPFIAEFLYLVMEQLQPCRFTEADRNKRRLKDVGCIGVECKHCAGQVDGRKFFWSSVNAVESNFVSVHTHMMECRMVPDELKEKLGELKKLRKEQTAALKTGSQKAFFSRVWQRLHGDQEARDQDTTTSTSNGSSPTLSPAMSSECPSPMISRPETVLVNGVSDEMKQMSVVEI